jgi:hypothetical protein
MVEDRFPRPADSLRTDAAFESGDEALGGALAILV